MLTLAQEKQKLETLEEDKNLSEMMSEIKE